MDLLLERIQVLLDYDYDPSGGKDQTQKMTWWWTGYSELVISTGSV
jgi:hypothetical protein